MSIWGSLSGESVFFAWPASPEGHVGGGGGRAAFTLLFFVVVVVGKVEGPPDKDQDQGEDGVGGGIEAGEVEDAVFGRILSLVKHSKFSSHFQLSVGGRPYFHQAVTGAELYFAGVENFLFPIQVLAKVGAVLHNRSGTPLPESKQAPVPAQGKQEDHDHHPPENKFTYAVQFHAC